MKITKGSWVLVKHKGKHAEAFVESVDRVFDYDKNRSTHICYVFVYDNHQYEGKYVYLDEIIGVWSDDMTKKEILE